MSRRGSSGRTLTLRDGRRLAFAEYGDPDGTPVFHFNGSLGSRLERPPDLSILDDLAVRLICSDRPAHGLSDPHRGRSLRSWSRDLRELADHLRLDTFHVCGWSAGGPHALACARFLSDRVEAAAIVSGLAPTRRPRFSDGLQLPRAAQSLASLWTPMANLPALMGLRFLLTFGDRHAARLMASQVPPADAAVFRAERNWRVLIPNLREGFRQGYRGPAEEITLVLRPWGFDLREIRTRVDVWQGTEDQSVSYAQGRFQHCRLRHSRFHAVRGAGHVYLFERWGEILERLVE